jgi:beta-glucosidase
VANVKGKVTVSFDVKNVGGRAGSATPQVYIGPNGDFAGWEAPKRLAGFAKVALAPGAVRHISLTVDPRLLATYNKGWVIKGGTYDVSLGASSRDIKDTAPLTLSAQTLPANYQGN